MLKLPATLFFFFPSGVVMDSKLGVSVPVMSLLLLLRLLLHILKRGLPLLLLLMLVMFLLSLLPCFAPYSCDGNVEAIFFVIVAVVISIVTDAVVVVASGEVVVVVVSECCITDMRGRILLFSFHYLM